MFKNVISAGYNYVSFASYIVLILTLQFITLTILLSVNFVKPCCAGAATYRVDI